MQILARRRNPEIVQVHEAIPPMELPPMFVHDEFETNIEAELQAEDNKKKKRKMN